MPERTRLPGRSNPHSHPASADMAHGGGRLMARARRFTNEQLDEIRRLRARGMTLESIADRFGAPLSTVATALRYGYRDLPVPTLPRSQPGRPRRFPEATVKLIADRRAEGYSLTEIAKELGASLSVVQRAAANYPRDPRNHPLKTCPTCHRAF